MLALGGDRRRCWRSAGGLEAAAHSAGGVQLSFGPRLRFHAGQRRFLHLRGSPPDAIGAFDGALDGQHSCLYRELSGIMRESVAVKHSTEPARKSSADDVVRSFVKSVNTGKRFEKPYRHWLVRDCLPSDTVDDVIALPFEAPSLDGIS